MEYDNIKKENVSFFDNYSFKLYFDSTRFMSLIDIKKLLTK